MQRPKEFDAEIIGLGTKLRRMAGGFVPPSDRDDLAQETILRALAAWHQRDKDKSMLAWLRSIMRNVFLVNYRKNKGFVNTGDTALPSIAEPARQFDATRIGDALKIASQSEHNAEFFGRVMGRTSREMSDEIGESIQTIEKRISRVRSRLVAA